MLAYLGDGIYELYVRQYLISLNIVKVDILQKEAIKFVSAKSQSKYLKLLTSNNFFSEEEVSIILRARNHKGTNKPKNTDIITYKHATSLEALIGYLNISGNDDRIKEIMKEIISLNKRGE